jgi:hypothetical protein
MRKTLRAAGVEMIWLGFLLEGACGAGYIQAQNHCWPFLFQINGQKDYGPTVMLSVPLLYIFFLSSEVYYFPVHSI